MSDAAGLNLFGAVA